MRMWSKIFKCFVCTVLMLFLAGCVEKEIVDEVNLIDGIGFDYSEKNRIRCTVTFPVYLRDQPPKNKSFTAESVTKITVLQEIQRQTADPIVTGNLEVALFGKQLAEKEGILDLIDPFQRDPGVGTTLYMAIVDGEAKEVLEGTYGITGTANHISKMIEHNIKTEELPKTNLQIFLSNFYQKGKTPYMPQIKKIAKDKVKINGICLIKNGKVVDFVSTQNLFFFRLLTDKFSHGMHRVNIDKGEAVIRSIRSSHDFTLTRRDPYEITIHIKVNGIINEFTGNTLTAKTISKLEEQFEKKINAECLALINKFQAKEVDPIGFGKFVRTQTRNFDVNRWWNSQYKNMTVKIKSEVKITEGGVIK
jgi:spore germination protein